MAHRRKKPKAPKGLEARLDLVERLHNQYKITDRMMDVLDAIARTEARALTFEDALEEFLSE